ncbi:MAG TPA: putative DNA modification/repair radical SAM protein [Planctomycetota bacterium]|nr:putative DNA modification/repair radical SAM protein [Planctomycetota bacterium]
MDESLRHKLAILAEAARYDASCASSGVKRERPAGGLGNGVGMGICHSFTPDGRCVSLLKLLLTNHCVYDCRFCVNRTTSATERARFTPDEVVRLTIDFYRRNYIEGLFLSSGIITSPDHTMAELAEVARRLREEHAFGGYIHLKAAPGASADVLFEAGRWADRISANIEFATDADLRALAPAKTHAATEAVMATLKEGIDAARAEPGRGRFVPAGQSTQMVVGASPTSDATILRKAEELYARHGLKRVYYSAFSPIPHPDPSLPLVAAPLAREHRLYQADWMVRHYGFRADEVLEPGADLPLERDPKLDWALRHRGFFPVDVNTAPREALLRIPGCGVKSVDRIISIRRQHRLCLADLRALRVRVAKARPFLIASDHLPPTRELDALTLGTTSAQPRQLELDLFAGGGER